MQERSEKTRQNILAVAAELFDRAGYGATPLSDILEGAKISKGAFYYHFDTKQAVAEAIIEQAESCFRETNRRILADSSQSPLETVIRLSFVVPRLHTQDKLTHIANELRQALHQVSPAGAAAYAGRYAESLPLFVDALNRAVQAGEIRTGIDLDKLAWTLWATSVGNRLLSDATGADIVARTTDMWEIFLPAIATEVHRQRFADRVAQLGASPPAP